MSKVKVDMYGTEIKENDLVRVEYASESSIHVFVIGFTEKSVKVSRKYAWRTSNHVFVKAGQCQVVTDLYKNKHGLQKLTDLYYNQVQKHKES